MKNIRNRKRNKSEQRVYAKSCVIWQQQVKKDLLEHKL